MIYSKGVRFAPFILLFLSHVVSAQGQFYTCDEFQTIALQTVGKVDLFQEIWRLQPKAELFGGVSRDYLFWVKSQLDQAKSKEEFDVIVSLLAETKTISVREFLLAGSDVDVVVAPGKLDPIDAKKYGLLKIEAINSNRFNSNHPHGKTEESQGFSPVEKIRLRRDQVKKDGRFGDGTTEICKSKFSVTFTSEEKFESGYFAKKDIAHPVLLAIRMIRVLSLAYLRKYGSGVVDPAKVEALYDSHTKEKLRWVFAQTLVDPKFTHRLTQTKDKRAAESFQRFLSKSLSKAAAGFVNPSVSEYLFEDLGAHPFLLKYWDQIPDAPRLFRKASDGRLKLKHCDDKTLAHG